MEGTFLVGTLLEHSRSLILIPTSSVSFQIIPFHSTVLSCHQYFSDYIEQLFQCFLIFFHLSDFLGLFEVSIMFFLMFFDFCWGVLVDFLDFFGFIWDCFFFPFCVFFWNCFEWLDLFFYIWFWFFEIFWVVGLLFCLSAFCMRADGISHPLTESECSESTTPHVGVSHHPPPHWGRGVTALRRASMSKYIYIYISPPFNPGIFGGG